MTAPPRDVARLKRGVQWNVVGTVGQALLPLFLVVAGRLYGVDVLGQFTPPYLAMELLVGLAVTGFVDGVQRRVARDPLHQTADDEAYAVLARSLIRVVVLGVCATLAVAAAGGWIAGALWHRPALHPVMVLLAANVPLVGVTAVLCGSCTALLHLEQEVLVRRVAVPSVLLALTVLLAGVMPDALGLAWAVTGANAVGLVLAIVGFRRHYSVRRVWRARRMRPEGGVTRFALVQGLNLMLWQGLYSIDSFILAAYVSDRELGLYRFAGEIARSLTVVRTQFSTPYSALAARYLRDGSREALQDSLVRTTRWILTLAVPVCAAAWLYRDPLLALVAPAGPRQSGFMLWLLLGQLSICALGLTGNTLIMAGHNRYNLANSAVLSAVNVALNFALIPHWGLSGSAVATCVALAGVQLLQMVQARRLLGVRMHPARWARPVVAGAIAMAAALALAPLLPAPAVAQGILFAAIYLAGVLPGARGRPG